MLDLFEFYSILGKNTFLSLKKLDPTAVKVILKKRYF